MCRNGRRKNLNITAIDWSQEGKMQENLVDY
jgi:hypothetical protein